MNIFKAIFQSKQEKQEQEMMRYAERRRIEKEALEKDGNYYNNERYAETIKPYLNEPIHKEYITKEMIRLLMYSFRDQDCIRSFGGGWRGYFGEEYIMMKGGWTPTIAEDKDPIVYFRKHQAAHYAARVMGEMWQSGFMDKLANEVLESIDKEFNS